MTPEQRAYFRESTRRYREADPERARRQWREYKHRKQLLMTGGRPRPSVCDVCGGAKDYSGRICLDHDHRTGLFRGWLCHRCNLMLGKADDDAQLLRMLADYLEKGRPL